MRLIITVMKPLLNHLSVLNKKIFLLTIGYIILSQLFGTPISLNQLILSSLMILILKLTFLLRLHLHTAATTISNPQLKAIKCMNQLPFNGQTTTKLQLKIFTTTISPLIPMFKNQKSLLQLLITTLTIN